MKPEILLRDYQTEAVNACLNAVSKGQKRVFVEMPVGSGISTVLITVAKNLLSSNKVKQILWLTDTLQMQEQQLNLARDMIADFRAVKQPDFLDVGITFATIQSVLRENSKVNVSLYNAIILGSSSSVYQKLNALMDGKVVIGNVWKLKSNGLLYNDAEVVYNYRSPDFTNNFERINKYSYEVETFCAKVLEEYGSVNQEVHLDNYDADFREILILNRIWCLTGVEVNEIAGYILATKVLDNTDKVHTVLQNPAIKANLKYA
ncbi:MAG: DEAD/DEAH box helicase family protein [Oscillospiraceae bacterium]